MPAIQESLHAPAASSSRSQVTLPTTSAAACLTWERFSASVRERPSMKVGVVTQLVTQRGGSLAAQHVSRGEGSRVGILTVRVGQVLRFALDRLYYFKYSFQYRSSVFVELA